MSSFILPRSSFRWNSVPSATTIEIDGIAIELVRKRIRNIHLRVCPPDGSVRISAPLRMSLGVIRDFAISRVGWIRKHQQKMRERPQAPPLNYVDGERLFVWGRPYLLQIRSSLKNHSLPFKGRARVGMGLVISHHPHPNLPPEGEGEGVSEMASNGKNAHEKVELNGENLLLYVPAGAGHRKKQAVLDAWYRDRLLEALPELAEKWERATGVKAARYSVRKMKSRWGSCNPRTRDIRLNTELAKHSPACLEYVLVHELAHVLEASHNHRFKALMDRFMPKWRALRQELRRGAPLLKDEG